jgi:hypothetical protein
MITKLFRKIEIRIALRTESTTIQHLGLKEKMTDKYCTTLGVAKIALKYVGQTGRTFRTRNKDYIRGIKRNGNTSEYAQHILDTAHNYESIEETMKILHVAKKSKMLDTLENCYIYKITKHGIR